MKRNFRPILLWFLTTIKASPYDRQFHLERAARFLTKHEEVWWKKNRICY